MLAAMAEVASEMGAENVTVALVVGRAGVSRRTFYEIFEDCDDCFLAAFDDAVARTSAFVLPAYHSGGDWRERIRAALTALLSFFDDNPFVGRFLVVESLSAGRRPLERRSRALSDLVAAVDGGRSEAKSSVKVASLAAEGVVGAVFSVIHARLLEGSGSLVELVNPLMSMIVLPYFGPVAANKELERSVAKSAPPNRIKSPNLLKGLEMRLTYRTARVLVAVACNPGSSNRVIGEASGIGDQGQISKLLGRLKKLGLVENGGIGSARGEPNAWMLTEQGEEVHGAIAGASA
jgi:AcrR family transcriptional regulator